MSEKRLRELRAQLKTNKAEQTTLLDEIHYLENQQSRQRRLVADQKVDQAKKWYPLWLAWCQENLKPGTKLKLSGTRDKDGIRLFLEWAPEHHWYGKPRIVCRQVIPKRWHQEPERLGQITEHLVDKISAVEIDGQMVSARKLVPQPLE